MSSGGGKRGAKSAGTPANGGTTSASSSSAARGGSAASDSAAASRFGFVRSPGACRYQLPHSFVLCASHLVKRFARSCNSLLSAASRRGPPSHAPLLQHANLTHLHANAKCAVFYGLSWQNPVLSGTLFAAGLGVFLAYDVLAFSLPAVALHVAFTAAAASAVIHVHNRFQPNSPLPSIVIPLDRGSVHAAASGISDRISGAVQSANELLSWSHPAVSARALAYSWLAARFAFLLSPGYLFLAFLTAFAAAPAYLQFQQPVDRAVREAAQPKLAEGAGHLATLEARVATVYATNTVPLQVAALGLSLLFLYLFWNVVSLTGIATCAYPTRVATPRSSAIVVLTVHAACNQAATCTGEQRVDRKKCLSLDSRRISIFPRTPLPVAAFRACSCELLGCRA